MNLQNCKEKFYLNWVMNYKEKISRGMAAKAVQNRE